MPYDQLVQSQPPPHLTTLRASLNHYTLSNHIVRELYDKRLRLAIACFMVRFMQKEITIHAASDYEAMRKAGRLSAEILDELTEIICPDITTDAINSYCHGRIVGAGAIPAPLGYRGFPKSVCTSVNHVVCHGIPDNKVLKDGDIINVDVTSLVEGWHGDTSRMYYVGNVGVKAQRLIQVTYDAMMRGIEQVRPGATTGDIGAAIQEYAEAQGFSVVRDYCGHGVGRVFHAAPNILHYGKRGEGVRLEEGMFFTIEPMINIGKATTRLNPRDGWTVTTRDRSLSAQFEHSLGVTGNGFDIFTASSTGKHCPPYGV
jgi:methionyl aminopeptidase